MVHNTINFWNIPCVCKKNVYYSVFVRIILYMLIRSFTLHVFPLYPNWFSVCFYYKKKYIITFHYNCVYLSLCQFHIASEGSVQSGSVQSLSSVWLFVTPWTETHQASLSIANSRSLLKLMAIKWVMPSNHLMLCCPLLLPQSYVIKYKNIQNFP